MDNGSNGNGTAVAERPTKQYLTTLQNTKLYNWVGHHRSRLERDGFTPAGLATEASAALGFSMTKNHVRRAVSDMNIRNPRTAAGSRGADQKTVEAIARATVRLYRKLGEPIPADLEPFAESDGLFDGNIPDELPDNA